jgi:hypothetical protein
MWEPVGPLPASVYRRRRWTAAALLPVALGLLGYGVLFLVGPLSGPLPESQTSSAAASRAAATAPQSTPPAPTPVAAVTSVPVAPGAGPSMSAPGPTPTSGANPERLQPDESPRPALPAPPPIPVPASGPVPCEDNMIKVAAEIDPVEHRVGQRPTMRLVVTNISKQPCVRDLDSSRQEIVVWSLSGDRLWSSNDCVNYSELDLRTLVPGQPVAFAVSWAGRTSAPGCAGPRTVVPAGDYRVMSRVDGVISAATDFHRLP